MDNVKLASELLTLAKSMIAMKMDQVWENNNIRINHDGYHAMVVQELPAKGKKRLRYISMNTGGYDALHNNEFGSESLVDNIIDKLHLSSSTDFDNVKSILAKLVVDWKHKYPDVGNVTLSLGEGDKHFLEVEPANSKPMHVKGKDFELTSEWADFKVYSPDSDFHQADPHYTYYEASAPASARKLYKMLLQNPNLLKEVSWSGLSNWLYANKIGYNSQHSVWH